MNSSKVRNALYVCGMTCLVLMTTDCGKALPLFSGLPLENVDGSSYGTIYEVRTISTATGVGINPFSSGGLPFTSTVRSFGDVTNDSQWPFHFAYTYPTNNYQLGEVRLIMDVIRDNTVTEAINVDGVFSGYNPTFLNIAGCTIQNSPYPIYQGYGFAGCPFAGSNSNRATPFFLQYPFDHYRAYKRNTLDVSLVNLISPATGPAFSPAYGLYEVVSDGRVNVVTGDDAGVYQAYLIRTGYTISKNALSCTTQGPFTFQNFYVHNDGNSIGTPAFSAALSPVAGWANATTSTSFQSTEFYFDAPLVKTAVNDIILTKARVHFATYGTGVIATNNVKRRTASSPLGALVVNGQAVDEAGFNRALYTASPSTSIEAWEPDGGLAQTAWTSFVSSLVDNTATSNTYIDLISIFGANRVRDMLAQGKLNISLGGSVGFASGSAASSTRTITGPTFVNGPELELEGTYTMRECDIPDDPTSPITDNAPTVPSPTDCTVPNIISPQVVEITSNSAKVQWLTDSGANGRIQYGLTNPPVTTTTLDTTLKYYHEVVLTGLSAYKQYKVRIYSSNRNDMTCSGVAEGTVLPTTPAANVAYTPILYFTTLR